jgi:heme/copper-type cytochrome/quinol oxidase subunit 3
MSAQFADSSVLTAQQQEEQLRQTLALKNKRLALLIWQIANGFIFLFFIFANYLMRNAQPSWPPPGIERADAAIPAVLSVVLLVSSIPASRALNAIRRGDNNGMRSNLLITIALGAVFTLGMIYVIASLPYSGAYSSIVNTMNGFHALHALIGMGLLAAVAFRANRASKENHWTVEGSVVFWHFVDLMWVFFFLVLYVL